jgi:hypothetical protein
MAQARKALKPGFRKIPTPFLGDRDYSPAEVEFMMAVHRYKQKSCSQFPTLSEILKVLLSLGYKKENPV